VLTAEILYPSDEQGKSENETFDWDMDFSDRFVLLGMSGQITGSQRIHSSGKSNIFQGLKSFGFDTVTTLTRLPGTKL